MKKTILIACFYLTAHLTLGQSVTQTMLRLPDTGETTSFTTTFGEDADFAINPPFFTDNGDGTVTDTVTGLMWQQTDGGEMTVENARLYCDTLSLGGYMDWRLPDAHEAFSILNHQHANPALDATVFTTTNADYWWTRTVQANDSTKIWVTNAGGGIGNHPKSETISAGGTKKYHARAVRDITTPNVIPDHFTWNTGGVIIDHLTGLGWQQFPSADSITWEEALAFADTSTFGGYSDWRLPNIKELQSINDETVIGPSLNTQFFITGGVKKFWSSTSLPNQPTKAWYLDTQFGITTYDFKTLRHYVLCVRGNLNTTTAVQESATIQRLNSVYPSPVQNTAHLQFTVLKAKSGTIEIFNSLDEKVYEQQLKDLQPGKQEITWNASDLSAGIFYYLLSIDDIANGIITISGKFILVH